MNVPQNEQHSRPRHCEKNVDRYF